MFYNLWLISYILGTITLLVVKHDERAGKYRERSENLKTYANINGIPKVGSTSLRTYRLSLKPWLYISEAKTHTLQLGQRTIWGCTSISMAASSLVFTCLFYLCIFLFVYFFTFRSYSIIERRFALLDYVKTLNFTLRFTLNCLAQNLEAYATMDGILKLDRHIHSEVGSDKSYQ